jgi:hypothetical protein
MVNHCHKPRFQRSYTIGVQIPKPNQFLNFVSIHTWYNFFSKTTVRVGHRPSHCYTVGSPRTAGGSKRLRNSAANFSRPGRFRPSPAVRRRGAAARARARGGGGFFQAGAARRRGRGGGCPRPPRAARPTGVIDAALPCAEAAERFAAATRGAARVEGRAPTPPARPPPWRCAAARRRLPRARRARPVGGAIPIQPCRAQSRRGGGLPGWRGAAARRQLPRARRARHVLGAGSAQPCRVQRRRRGGARGGGLPAWRGFTAARQRQRGPSDVPNEKPPRRRELWCCSWLMDLPLRAGIP